MIVHAYFNNDSTCTFHMLLSLAHCSPEAGLFTGKATGIHHLCGEVHNHLLCAVKIVIMPTSDEHTPSGVMENQAKHSSLNLLQFG